MESAEQHLEACGESEDANSTCEEERIRKLFQACDCDGDGFIDSQDLLSVCRELNLEDSLDELMRELGADENGRISYQEFLRRRIALRPEIDALRSSSTSNTRHQCTEYLPTSSDNSLGATSAGKHESWEFDSGARDLSPEPHSLQKLVAAAGGSTSSGNLLQLANKLHLAALTSLKSDILDLTERLHAASQERDLLETALTKTEVERLRLEGDAEVQAHRITELHSVIAELSRKLDRQRSAVIAEENDQEQDRDDGQGDGHDGMPTTSLLDDEVVIEPEADCSDFEEGAIQRDITNADESEGQDVEQTIDDVVSNNSSDSELGHPLQVKRNALNRGASLSCRSLELAALREELIHIRAENSTLADQLTRQNAELARAQALRRERDRLKRKLKDLECRFNESDGVDHIPQPSSLSSIAPCSSSIPGSPSHGAALPGVPRDSDIPVLKVAERVRLKRMDQPITGPEIASVGVSTTQMAEHLVSALAEESDLLELGRHGHDEQARQQLDIEIERLHSRLEHSRAHNNVLSLSLEECKNQSDKLHLLVGKYESNAIALRLALGYADRATAAYDCLVALLESELALILRGASASKDEVDDRRSAERAAWSLLEAEQYGRCTKEGDWGPGDEQRLRELISRLKMDRSRVCDTIVELESVHAEALSTRVPVSLTEARKLDLETAVLMQELMAMREDKAELRARLYLLEKERAALELRLSSQDTQRQAQAASIMHLQSQLQELEVHSRDTTCGNEGDAQETELTAALRRESHLKSRVHELVDTLDKVSRNSEQRHLQSAELVNDLKRANSTLVQTLEKSKKKYQSRLKKLEQQMLSMVERHSCQVRTLKQRIVALEQETKSNISQPAPAGPDPHATPSETTL
ncbi:colorectal mutant cancer protein [Thrips palmi]|uniref:Colorectal mutant cancer protein n=1 Tax=Thrips palmi TaxID=161013 RepID=A0A6P8Y757_THRPL|nr:colorectal mutant cancer protein [Thrips palmi]